MKKPLLLILLFPLLNFIHESGHWLGAKAVGANPKMMFQRVDITDNNKMNGLQKSIYNWGGPTMNYMIIATSFVYPPLTPIGVIMSSHRLGPSLFAFTLYSTGNTRFTSDETKQFPSKYRLWAAAIFSLGYMLTSLSLLKRWMPNFKFFQKLLALASITALWLAYGMTLDFIDKKFF